MRFHDIDLFQVLSSKTKRKIVNFLLSHTASMSEREIASVLKISHMSVNRAMSQLAEMNFVNFITVGKAHVWEVNHKSYTYKILSQAGKKSLITIDPLQNLKQALLRHIPKALVEKITLFGSIANGTEKISSDIDVFLLAKNSVSKTKLEPYIEKLTNMCLENYGNRFAPYVLTRQELKTKKNLDIITEINQGIEIFPKRKDKK